MFGDAPGCPERLPAGVALVRFFPSVDGHVIPEFLTGLATLTALLTSERKLTAVHHHVNPESIGPGKSKSDH